MNSLRQIKGAGVKDRNGGMLNKYSKFPLHKGIKSTTKCVQNVPQWNLKRSVVCRGMQANRRRKKKRKNTQQKEQWQEWAREECVRRCDSVLHVSADLTGVRLVAVMSLGMRAALMKWDFAYVATRTCLIVGSRRKIPLKRDGPRRFCDLFFSTYSMYTHTFTINTHLSLTPYSFDYFHRRLCHTPLIQ